MIRIVRWLSTAALRRHPTGSANRSGALGGLGRITTTCGLSISIIGAALLPRQLRPRWYRLDEERRLK
jgi:hypothetical protein